MSFFMVIFIVTTAIFIFHSQQSLVQTHHNNFGTTLYRALRCNCCGDSVVHISLLLAFFMPVFFSCWNQLIDFCANQVTGFYIGLILEWKRLSIYPYYPVIINMLFFNRRFVTFLLRAILESNEVLADVFKNVKM